MPNSSIERTTIVKTTFIAGSKTDEDWRFLRPRLLRRDAHAWNEAFSQYFETRLALRYLNPIKVLQENDTSQGEGFSILAIQCSLIEFLESTAQGKNYRFLPRNQVPGPYEYSASQEIFVAFLQHRAPFSKTFDEASARDFYVGVRCGLLHEARTKNVWLIRANGLTNVVANVKDKVVYRNNFHSALVEYVRAYGELLKTDHLLQQAFVRKFDDLCN